MTTKEKIAVMQAYLDGKKIQFKFKDLDEWSNLVYKNYSSWNWAMYEYRIKPEPTYRPYESTDEMVCDFVNRFVHKDISKYVMPLVWIKDKRSNFKLLISEYFVSAVGECCVGTANCSYNMGELYHEFVYLDGTPCGKLVEE